MQMRTNRPFCEREDELILHLYNQQNIKNWGIVANTLTEQYNFPRNAKQCRDRYQQHLDTQMQQQWTTQQQMYLNKLHNSVGNKWSLIAQYFPGRTDNCLKNHFYSKLRKGLRYLNKIIKASFKSEFKEIKINCVYKIIESFEEKFKDKPHVSEEVSDHCAILKSMLLLLADKNQAEIQLCTDFTQVRQLITSVYDFNKQYKKKTKREKRESLEVEELFKPATVCSPRNKLLENHRNKNENEYHGEDEKNDDVENEKNDDGNKNKNNGDDESSFEEIVSNQSENCDEIKQQKEMKVENSGEIGNHNSDDKQEPELRKSPRVFVLVEDEELRLSNQSKLPISLVNPPDDHLHSSNRHSDESNKFNLLRWSGSNNPLKYPFAFMRGSSSFRSYQSQSNASQGDRVDMFGDIRLSEKLYQQVRMQQQNQDLFFSHKY